MVTTAASDLRFVARALSLRYSVSDPTASVTHGFRNSTAISPTTVSRSRSVPSQGRMSRTMPRRLNGAMRFLTPSLTKPLTRSWRSGTRAMLRRSGALMILRWRLKLTMPRLTMPRRMRLAKMMRLLRLLMLTKIG